jgi:dolichol-phosphate mannosyltransferase
MSKTLVIMPTYTESMNIMHSIEELFKFNPGVHLLVVDDNSPDGTAEIVETAKSDFGGKLFLLSRPSKAGLGPPSRPKFRFSPQETTPIRWSISTGPSPTQSLSPLSGSGLPS